jgi:S-DNA-T family DNA segregation ATPase FtsK/SpoIIIE
MLAPIVSDSEKALKLLKWSVDEMERRYTMLKDKRVKNIEEYNHKII